MSVINKVLRDLDQRHAAKGQGANASVSGDQAMRGTQVLRPVPSAASRWWTGAGAGGLLVLLVGLSVWWALSNRSATTPPMTSAPAALPVPLPVAAPIAEPAVVSGPAPVAAMSTATSSATNTSTTIAAGVAQVSATPLTADAVLPPTLGSRSASANLPKAAAAASATLASIPAPKVVAAPAKATPTEPDVAAAPSKRAPTPAATPALAVVPASTSVPAPSPIAAQSKPASDDIQAGVSQVLAQAQAMWSEGARSSAIDLLRQALSLVESANSDGTNAGGFTPVVAVARELARMELAEGQVSQAFKLLVRLEPKISQVADLWAMRANAAQRLGQHTEAAGSYQRALGLKADEPRWLLGLAVSLAAQGQITQAGELAEKARLMGALRPEIANYLRQLGVVIRSD